MSANANIDFLRKDVENINKQLGGRKMDLYEMARVDTDVGIEQSMKNMIKLRDEGHFKYIGLSEVSAETIRKAVKIAPISAVEIEYSAFFNDIESNGVLEACKEFGIVSRYPLRFFECEQDIDLFSRCRPLSAIHHSEQDSLPARSRATRISKRETCENTSIDSRMRICLTTLHSSTSSRRSLRRRTSRLLNSP